MLCNVKLITMEDNNKVTFHYCNSVFQPWKNYSMWKYVGFPALSGHFDKDQCGTNNKCEQIFLPNNDELKKLGKLLTNAQQKYNTDNSKPDDAFSWAHTYKLELVPDNYYKNTYTVISCTAQKGRFCPAK